jgi:hypothetical protein
MLEYYPGRTDRVGLWKNKFYMSPTERRIIKAVAAVRLRSLGYGLAFQRPRFPLRVALSSSPDHAYKRVSIHLLRRGAQGLNLNRKATSVHCVSGSWIGSCERPMTGEGDGHAWGG